MAGYAFKFIIADHAAGECRQFVAYFKSLAGKYDLDVHYRSRRLSPRALRFCVTVDGKLWAIQHLDRILSNEILAYGRAHSFPRRWNDDIFKPFLDGYLANVDDAADMIMASVKLLERSGYWTQTAPLTVSSRLQRISRLRRLTRPEYRGVRSLFDALDSWAAGYASREDAAILADKAMESWLKARCGLSRKSRKGFREVVDLAVSTGVASRRQATAIRRFHRSRNRLQHRGGRIRTASLISMLDHHLKVFDRWLNPELVLSGPRSNSAIQRALRKASHH